MLSEQLLNATYLPLALIDDNGYCHLQLSGRVGSRPLRPSDTRIVASFLRSRTKTSGYPFVSPLTRLSASLVKETKRPSELTEGRNEPVPSKEVACSSLSDSETLSMML